MRLIFTSYVSSPGFDQPELWLKRIEGYTGILEGLAQHHDVTSIEKINYTGDIKQKGVRYIFMRQAERVAYFPFKLHQAIKPLDPDVIFINGILFPLQLIQLRRKFGKKIKLILIHQSEKPYSGLKRFLQQWADQYVDAYLFPSLEAGLEWVEKKNIRDKNKIVEVMHGSSRFEREDKPKAREALGIEGSLICLWVGRLNENKDPLVVVKAFLQFLKLQHGARLYMIYQTEELLGDIRSMVENQPEAVNAIYFIGQVPHVELSKWYNAADVIISASHFEGGGIAITEAMSCGCIPVLTNIAAFKALTSNGECGMLYEAGNYNDLLDCLLKLKNMDLLMEKDKVLAQFRRHLSFDAITQKINQVISCPVER